MARMRSALPLLQATPNVRMVVVASSAHVTVPLASLESRVRQVSESFLLYYTDDVQCMSAVPVAAGEDHHMHAQVEYLYHMHLGWYTLYQTCKPHPF